MTPTEYLLQESQAEYKHEYRNGEIQAMAGASSKHNLIVKNILWLLENCLRHSDCLVYPSDLRVLIPACRRYVYPDVVVVCGEQLWERYKGTENLLNPTVIIEVTSESTSEYDHTEKLACYQTIESLKTYLLVSSTQIFVEKLEKNEQNEWIYTTAFPDNERIMVGECELLLAEIYHKVIFEESN
jgi:Uma2 family endonuclease